MRHPGPAPALTLLVLIALACSFAGGGSPTSPTVASPVATRQSTPTPEPEVLPSDFEAVLEAEVAAGTTSEGDGIIRLLRAFLGDPDAALPESYGTVRNDEGTGIVERANDYLVTGDDEQAKAQIRQLLETLIPTTEQLQAYGQPVASVARLGGAAAPAAQTDCARLWRRGFPMEGVARYPCFEYTVDSVPGIGAYGIYFPASWGPDDPGRVKLLAAALAAHDAVTAYRPYGDIGPVNLIFSLLPSPAGFLAEVNSRHPRGDEACPVLIFPNALGLDDPPFRQTLAHELFHCFQLRNLNDQMLGTERPVRKWWSEASAEYFSNVVYDDVNFEQRNQPDFDHDSTTTPLTEMAYENAVFFQYLASRLGDGEVLQFLRSMPTSGGEPEQLAALANYPEMQALFHDFARAYLEGRIPDRGGGDFPLNPDPGDELAFPPSSGLLQADPFVVRRFQVSFDDDLLYTLTTETSGAEGLNAMRLGFGEGAWGPIPGILNTACPHPPSTLLLTNAGSGSSDYEVSITVGTEEAGECDPCLIGTWQLDLDSYRQAFTTLMSPTALSGATLDEVSGTIQALFFDYGRVYSTIDDFVAGGNFTLGGQPARVEVTMQGTVDSFYFVAPGGGLTFLRPEEALATGYRVETRGVVIDVPGLELPTPGLISGTYTCSGDTLHLTPVDVGLEHPGLDYTRVR